MKTIGLITEYNPFHNGHLHQLNQVRERFGNDTALIAAMSGDWVQRGEPAVLDKQTRAATAVRCGVNLVIELPSIFATGSAGIFAGGAVKLLRRTGVIGQFCCGAEAKDSDLLHRIAELIADEPQGLSERLKLALRDGLNPGAAWSRAVAETFRRISGNTADGEATAAAAETALRGSNNWLAIEYIKAACRAEADGDGRIRPVILPREGQPYLDSTLPAADSETPAPAAAGATTIRSTCAAAITRCEGQPRIDPVLWQTAAAQMPSAAAGALLSGILNGRICLPCHIGGAAAQYLLSAVPAAAEATDGLSPELFNRLQRQLRLLGDCPPDRLWAALLKQTVSRNFTAAQIGRALTSGLLGITTADRQAAIQAGPAYIRILAFDAKGRYLLKRMRTAARIPIITRESDFLEYRDRGPVFRQSFELDRRAAQLRSLMTGRPLNGTAAGAALFCR